MKSQDRGGDGEPSLLILTLSIISSCFFSFSVLLLVVIIIVKLKAMIEEKDVLAISLMYIPIRIKHFGCKNVEERTMIEFNNKI